MAVLSRRIAFLLPIMGRCSIDLNEGNAEATQDVSDLPRWWQDRRKVVLCFPLLSLHQSTGMA